MFPGLYSWTLFKTCMVFVWIYSDTTAYLPPGFTRDLSVPLVLHGQKVTKDRREQPHGQAEEAREKKRTPESNVSGTTCTHW
jgi:hypothetical protein